MDTQVGNEFQHDFLKPASKDASLVAVQRRDADAHPYGASLVVGIGSRKS